MSSRRSRLSPRQSKPSSTTGLSPRKWRAQPSTEVRLRLKEAAQLAAGAAAQEQRIVGLQKGVIVPYVTVQSAGDDALAEAALATCHATDGPRKIAEVVADHLRATGRLYPRAMDLLMGAVSDDELTDVLREAGVPSAMMEWASRLAEGGDYDGASRLRNRVERVFGAACARQLDEVHGVSVAFTK